MSVEKVAVKDLRLFALMPITPSPMEKLLKNLQAIVPLWSSHVHQALIHLQVLKGVGQLVIEHRQ